MREETNSQGFTIEQLQQVQSKYGPVAIEFFAKSLNEWTTCTNGTYNFDLGLSNYLVHHKYLEKAKKMFTKEEKFWMVLRGNPNSAVSRTRHTTFDSAKEEAEGLARQEQRDFYILEVVGKVVVPEQPLKYVEI